MMFCLGMVVGASLVLLFALCAAAKQGDQRLDDARNEMLRANEDASRNRNASRNRVHYHLPTTYSGN